MFVVEHTQRIQLANMNVFYNYQNVTLKSRYYRLTREPIQLINHYFNEIY